MRRYRNRLLAGLLIVFALYLAFLLVAPTGALLGTLQTFPLWLLGPLVLLQGVAFLCRWLEWHYYLGVVGARDKISVLDSMLIQAAGFTLSVSPGKAAEVLKAAVLKLKTGVPMTRSAPITFAERVVDGAAVVVLMALVLLIGGPAVAIVGAREVVVVSALLLAVGLVVVQVRPLATFGLGLVARVPGVRRAHDALADFIDSTREVFALRHIAPMTLVGTGVYLSDALSFALVLWGFGLPLTGTMLMQAALLAGLSSAIGAASLVPNGAGVTEVAGQWLLQNALGMAAGPAYAAAVVQGFFHKWFRVLVGAVVAFVFRKRLMLADLDRVLAQADAHAPPTPGPTAPIAARTESA